MTGMDLPLNTSQETGNAIAAEMKKYHSVVAIAASNDPELAEPMPLHVPLTTQQIRDIVWLALDRDYSPRSLLHSMEIVHSVNTSKGTLMPLLW